MVKYKLFVDESGDFDTDLVPGNKKSGSLVGGFLCKSEVCDNSSALENTIARLIKGKKHATDLPPEQKGPLAHSLLTAAKKFDLEFVIFQNDVKKKIVTSTQTYLTVITEGVMQLLKKLVILENDSIELSLVVGYKKDTTIQVTNSYVDGYIKPEDYKSRIFEKLEIEKAKINSESIQKSRINIALADDKRNNYLILCDFICNFWYTKKKSQAFQIMIDGVKIKAHLQKLFNKQYIFSLFTTEENEHVLRMQQDGVYADALFEICAEMLSENNEQLIKESFLNLPLRQMHRQLAMLADYIGGFMDSHIYDELGKKILIGANKLNSYLKDHGKENLKFFLDVKLYWLAYLNQIGEYEAMEKDFESIRGDIAKYTMQTMDMDYMLMYYNRMAVYYNDKKRYDECVNACDKMVALLELVEAGIKGNGFIELTQDSKSIHKGKVLGTKLQAQIALCCIGKESYENVARTSDEAIAQFTYDEDLNRQYQYRAELEAVSGHVDSALEWIERSFGRRWKEQLNSKDREIFDIYNMLYIAAMTRDIDEVISGAIAQLVYKNNLCDSIRNRVIREYCLMFLGYAMLKYDSEAGKKILDELKNSEVEEIAQLAGKVLDDGKDIREMYC